MADRQQWKKLWAAVEDGGFIVEKTKRGSHWLVRNKDGEVLAGGPSTASDWRSYQNTVAGIRRATGLPLRDKQTRRRKEED